LGYQPRLIADSPRRLYQIYSSWNDQLGR
jgi:hypothetical protein